MIGIVADILRRNGLEHGHYAEPYAGGCGLALSLLYGAYVDEIHVNDIDPSIWAFWHCVLYETRALVARIEQTPVNIDEWMRQRDVHRKQDVTDTLSLAFSTFFLNRTNRSGIIKGAGVIGGLQQHGAYKIDCRYNQTDLIRRIVRVSRYAERIHLSNSDGLAFIESCEKHLPSHSLMFIDPPYYKKGSELYTSFYEERDHALLAEKVSHISLPWIVTYDDEPQIRRFYKDRRQYSFDIAYSVQEKRLGSELLVASKGLKIPETIRDRQVNRPQYRAA